MSDWRDNPPPPEQVPARVEVEGRPVSHGCTFEIEGAGVVTDDGRALPALPVRAYGAVASILEHRFRTQYGQVEIVGEVEIHDDWIEISAIWHDERLVDSEGADFADRSSDYDDEEYAAIEAEWKARLGPGMGAALVATSYFGRTRVQPVTAKAAEWLRTVAPDGAEWDGASLLVTNGSLPDIVAAAKRDGRTMHVEAEEK